LLEAGAEVVDEPYYHEVERVIKDLKNCKASAEDGLVTALLKKVVGPVLWRYMHAFIRDIWKQKS
jgi:hypothetical protein